MNTPPDVPTQGLRFVLRQTRMRSGDWKELRVLQQLWHKETDNTLYWADVPLDSEASDAGESNG